MAFNIKYNHIFGITGFLLAVSLVGCTDEWDNSYYLKSKPTDYIVFAADNSSITASATTRSSSGQFKIEVEEWPLEAKKETSTRVAPISSLSGQAGLIGYAYSGNWSDSNTPWDSMDNGTYNFIADTYALISDNPLKWNAIPSSDSLRVYAYAPKSFVETNATLTHGAGVPTITYTVPKDNDPSTPDYSEQQDLLSSVKTVHSTYKDSIPMSFKHALTGIQFKIGFACTVKSISISNVYKKGTYKLGDFSNTAWTPVISGTPANDVGTYTIDFGEGTYFAKDAMITGAGSTLGATSTLMLIPQTIPSGATVSLTYNDGSDHTISASIAENKWLPNKLITYTIYKEEVIDYIYFDLAAGNITINASTYTGKIYKTENDETTAITVTGSHNAANHYYVYQSSTKTGSSGYYTGTGYVSGTGGASSTDGKTTTTHPITIPAYARVTGPDGRPWSEYITDNPNVGGALNSEIAADPSKKGIIEIWPEQVALVGRESTYQGTEAGAYKKEHTITISGSTIGTCNLTIDNIYSNYHDKDIVNSSGDSFNEGTITYNADGTNNRLIITLVGDNRIGHLQYSNKASDYSTATKDKRKKENDRNNFLIFEGSGSITVADAHNCLERTTTSDDYHYKVGKMNNYHGTAIGSSSQSDLEDVYGIVINSGVIFAGTTLGDNGTAIGGGGNGVGEITINGGTVTCVSSTTGSALGGGIAFTSYPGIGYVTINGGNVYAYNLDNQRNIPSSAIGGGGSSDYAGGKGDVTITGGNVKAIASIGTAIGGGSSGKQFGGEAIITITGGNIVAQSIEGTDRHSSRVGGGNGIGGGTAMAERGTSSSGYNGGNANVTISGNPVIITGSIGGGPTRDGNANAKAGYATVDISGDPQIQGQFVLDAGTSGTPTFKMSGGRIYNNIIMGNEDDEEYVHIKRYGGAVYLGDGVFSMSGGTIENCSAPLGGAVYMTGGKFTMSGGTIQNVSATQNGGAVYMASGEFRMGYYYDDGDTGEVTPILGTSPTITNCTASEFGGAVYMAGGTANIKGGTISFNKAKGESASVGDGGGFLVNGGSFFMGDLDSNSENGPTITRNSATRNGGGVALGGGTVQLTGGTVSSNTSGTKGGGIYITEGTFEMSDGFITGNAAKQTGGGVSVSSSEALTVNLTGGSITGNTSEDKGGGISIEPTASNTVTMNIGDGGSSSLVNPDISTNGAIKGGGGIYIGGTTSTININSGKLKNNTVSTHVDNNDVENTGGMVFLNGGDVDDVVVVYHRNDGSSPDKTSSQRILKAANSQLICPTFVHPGSRIFKEWRANPDGTGATYTDGQIVNVSSTLNIYAIWND